MMGGGPFRRRGRGMEENMMDGGFFGMPGGGGMSFSFTSHGPGGTRMFYSNGGGSGRRGGEDDSRERIHAHQQQ